MVISFTSEDRQRAADVANAVANAYLEEKLDARYESVSRASTWLEGRLTELRDKAVASDQLVQNYKRDNGIIDTNAGGGQLLSDTQLTDLSARLVEAQKETATRRARYDQIAQMIASGNPDASVVDSLESSGITQLRQQYSRLAQQEAEVSRRYGAGTRSRAEGAPADGRHQRAHSEGARADRADVQSDLEVASKQRQISRNRSRSYTARSSTIAQALVRLRELERNAQADQNLYESFLDRYKSAMQQQSFPITDARVLTEASPARKKSSPKTVITFALSGIAGAGARSLAGARPRACRPDVPHAQPDRARSRPCMPRRPAQACPGAPALRVAQLEEGGLHRTGARPRPWRFPACGEGAAVAIRRSAEIGEARDRLRSDRGRHARHRRRLVDAGRKASRRWR